MARVSSSSVRTVCVACLLALLATAADADVVVGPFSDLYGDSLAFSYSVTTPYVQSGSPGSAVPILYDPEAMPLLKVYQVVGPVYHHLHIVEHWIVAGDETAYDWNEMLMVPDGYGGWTPSGNYDDLWFSAKAAVTPMPTTSPEATTIFMLNQPLDILFVEWGAGLLPGTEFVVDKWITVGPGITTFAIYQFQELTVGIPEPASLALLGLGLAALLRRRRA